MVQVKLRRVLEADGHLPLRLCSVCLLRVSSAHHGLGHRPGRQAVLQHGVSSRGWSQPTPTVVLMSAAPAVPPRQLDGPGSPHLSLGGYFCPQCHAKYTELPVECKVCGKSAQSGCLLPAGSQQTLQPSASCAPSSRLDSGVGPPPGQVLSPPLPPPSLHRESCR